MVGSRFRLAITGLTIILAWPQIAVGESTWTENSFEDFRDGTFTDGGSNLYVSAQGRLQLINRWDLDGDGNLDIVTPSGHGQTEKEDIYVYLNTGTDIDGRSRIRVAANGSRDGLVCDLNQDGYQDLVVTNNDNGTTDWTDTFVYYGSPAGYSAQHRTTLPSHASTDVAVGDFNADGWVDIAIACQFTTGSKKEPGEGQMSLVYWNSPVGFQAESRQSFSYGGVGASSVVAGDIDRDGKDDLAFSSGGKIIIYYSSRDALNSPENIVELSHGANRMALGDVDDDQLLDLILLEGNSVEILLGTENGFSTDSIASLAAKSASDLAVADLDGDGKEDVVVANLSGEHGATWISSYVYYADGGDFSTRERLELPTIGASAVSAGDLNGDGLPELVFSNMRTLNLHKLLSYVYWNKGGSFRFENLTQLATLGSVGNTIGDVNNDGKPDVIFFNHEGYQRDGYAHSTIYWGDGTRAFDVNRSSLLYSHYMTSLAHADLDDDGHVDLLMTQARFINGMSHEQHSVFMYWGSERRFEEGVTVQSNLPLHGGPGGVRVVDFNRDGYLDLLVGASTKDPQDPEKHGITFFWGSQHGFSVHRRSIIPIEPVEVRCPLPADFNQDGWLDLAAQVDPKHITFFWGSEGGETWSRTSTIELDQPTQLMYLNTADLNRDGWLDLIAPVRKIGYSTERDSFVYYGSAEGFAADHREMLPTYGPYDLSVADFNRDGWLDLFMNSYKGDYHRDYPALLYWGSKDGLRSRDPQRLMPGYASVASEAADYDGDGWIDVLSANHRQEGSTTEPGPHQSTTRGFLLWNGPDGFSGDRRWEYPLIGPHGFNLRDVGNSIDRGLFEDYVSSPHPFSETEQAVRVRWQAETPHGTQVKLQLRFAGSEQQLLSAAWTGPEGPDTWYRKPDSRVLANTGAWIQYRARLKTPNGGPTPYLTSVSIEFHDR